MRETPVSAVILAAGEGRRLEPLTNRRPKPMIPVANRPLLEYVVDAVAEAGLDHITLVVGYRHERIRSHFGDGDNWDVTIEYVEQPKQLGTGHAVLQAESAIDGPFVVLNGDRIVDSTLVERVAAAARDGDCPSMAVTTSETPREYGVVSFNGDRVTGIDEKPEGPVETNRINAGVYGFSPTIFEAIRSTDVNSELALTATLNDIASETGGINGITYTGRWLDVSNLWDLLTVNAGLIDTVPMTPHESRLDDPTVHIVEDVVLADSTRIGPMVTVGGNTAIGPNVTIEANATVENTIIFPDAVIGAGAVVRDAVVAGNAQIGPNVTIEGTPSTIVVENTVHHDIELGGIVGDNATIGPGSILTTGAVVGNDVDTDAGVAIDSRVTAGATVRRG